MAVLPPSSQILASTTASSQILTLLAPALTHSFNFASIFRRLISTTALFVLFRAYILSALLLRHSLYTTQILLIRSYCATMLLSKQGCLATKTAMRMAWKSMEPLGKRILFEIALFLLGGGNLLLLVIFWPGWIVIGGVLGVWRLCG